MEARISIVTLGVRDLERAYQFYKDGLGFLTTSDSASGIVFFQTGGTCLALYPLDSLAKDVAADLKPTGGFGGITLAHNTRSKAEVDVVLALAEAAGGKINKPAQDVFWGGYGGYFSDPDGHLWEVAYADSWKFKEDGSLLIE